MSFSDSGFDCVRLIENSHFNQCFKVWHFNGSWHSHSRLGCSCQAGNRTSAQELRHQFRKISLTSAHVIFFHGAEVNIPIELGAEVNIGCRSPQVGAEVNLCRSYSCRTSIASKQQVRKMINTMPIYCQFWSTSDETSFEISEIVSCISELLPSFPPLWLF